MAKMHFWKFRSHFSHTYLIEKIPTLQLIGLSPALTFLPKHPNCPNIDPNRELHSLRYFGQGVSYNHRRSLHGSSSTLKETPDRSNILRGASDHRPILHASPDPLLGLQESSTTALYSTCFLPTGPASKFLLNTAVIQEAAGVIGDVLEYGVLQPS